MLTFVKCFSDSLDGVISALAAYQGCKCSSESRIRAEKGSGFADISTNQDRAMQAQWQKILSIETFCKALILVLFVEFFQPKICDSRLCDLNLELSSAEQR